MAKKQRSDEELMARIVAKLNKEELMLLERQKEAIRARNIAMEMLHNDFHEIMRQMQEDKLKELRK